MRTTLDIEDDALAAAREIAARDRKPLGHVVSVLLRQALTRSTEASGKAATPRRAATGFRAFPSRGVVVTNAEIDRLRDAEGL